MLICSCYKELNKIGRFFRRVAHSVVALHPTLNKWGVRGEGKREGSAAVVFFADTGTEDNLIALHVSRWHAHVVRTLCQDTRSCPQHNLTGPVNLLLILCSALSSPIAFA